MKAIEIDTIRMTVDSIKRQEELCNKLGDCYASNKDEHNAALCYGQAKGLAWSRELLDFVLKSLKNN